jgi:hypothetical protein
MSSQILEQQQQFEQQLHRSASLGHAFSDRTVAQVRNASERATHELQQQRLALWRSGKLTAQR